jgi:hypothetical protein
MSQALCPTIEVWGVNVAVPNDQLSSLSQSDYLIPNQDGVRQPFIATWFLSARPLSVPSPIPSAIWLSSCRASFLHCPGVRF